jgi:hypothetical protein
LDYRCSRNAATPPLQATELFNPRNACPAILQRTSSERFVILTPVLVMYGIYVLCTVALVWAAIAMTRHILEQRRATRARAEHHHDDHV